MPQFFTMGSTPPIGSVIPMSMNPGFSSPMGMATSFPNAPKLPNKKSLIGEIQRDSMQKTAGDESGYEYYQSVDEFERK